MEVIGVGLGRTGTNSLKIALEELGYRAFHTKEVFANQTIFNTWYNAIFSHPKPMLGDPDFDLIVAAGFTASTDVPVALYYKTLLHKYPDAKFILTTHKSPDAWFVSWQQHVKNMEFVRRYAPWLPMMDKVERYTRWLIALLHKGDESFLLADNTLKSSPIQQNSTLVIQTYSQHNERVRENISADRLLEFHVAQGWEPLCDFLNKPVPSHPFPKTNSTAQVTFLCAAVVVISNSMLLVSLFLMWKIVQKLLNANSTSR